MKQRIFLICLTLIVFWVGYYNVYAVDSITRIELRNVYKQFEKCMGSYSNDITECLEAFNKAVNVHKEALKKEPANEDIKKTLLLLVNTMNNIAETYYLAAEKKKGLEPATSKKYYTKASICFEQLINLYPSKTEFKEILNKAKYLAKYEEVEEYLLEIKNRKRLDFALLTLQKLKASRDSFSSSFGQNEKLNNDINEVVAQLEGKVTRLFQGVVEKQKTEDMKSLIYLIQAQISIIDFQGKQDYKNNLLRMENTTIGIIKKLIESYKADFQIANSDYNKGGYSTAAEAFDRLIVKMQSFPDYNSARPDLQTRISKATNNFNIEQLRKIVGQKAQVAKTTDSFLSIMDNGKHAFKQKDWIAAYDTFKEADEFARGKQLAVNANISQEWLNKVLKKIDDLNDDEITNFRLAKMHYKPMSYSEWLGVAKNGKFPTKYVSLSGEFQQKIGNVVILRKETIDYDWSLEIAFQSYQMNSTGLIFNKKRFFKEGDFISCIGKFKKIGKFETLLGEKIEIPVFKIIYY